MLHVTWRSLHASMWAIAIGTRWTCFGSDNMLDIHGALRTLNKPLLIEGTDAHSLFMSIVRDHCDDVIAKAVIAKTISSDDAFALNTLLDGFCLSSTVDPKYHQRLDHKHLYLARGQRPIFAKRSCNGTCDLYLAGPKDLGTCMQAVVLDEATLQRYKERKGVDLTGILSGFYKKSSEGFYIDTKKLPRSLSKKLKAARDDLLEEADAGEDDAEGADAGEEAGAPSVVGASTAVGSSHLDTRVTKAEAAA